MSATRGVFISGQRSIAETVLGLCLGRGTVTGASAPVGDRFYARCLEAGVTVSPAEKRLGPERIPSGTDLIVCAYSHEFITSEASARSTYGAVGYHPSLLPRHRGKRSVQDTVSSGDLVAGGTIYRLTDSWDAGPVLLQGQCLVLPAEDARELWRRSLQPIGEFLLAQILDFFFAGGDLNAIGHHQ